MSGKVSQLGVGVEDSGQKESVITVGAWPRFGVSNPRNTIMYDEVNELELPVRVIDIKKNPLKAFTCNFVHFHWPEKAFAGKAYPLKVVVFMSFVLLLKLARIKIMQTVHNDWRTEIQGTIRRKLFRFYQAHLVDLFFVPGTGSLKRIPDGARFKFLPLGIYPKNLEVDDVGYKDYFLISGAITRKKSVHKRIAGIGLEESDLLVVVGKPEDEEIRLETEREILSTHKNTAFELEFVSEGRLHALVRNARAVVVLYDQGLNSGVLTLCATYNTPVVCNLENIEKDMLRIYGQQFSRNCRELKHYESTDISIKKVSKRFVDIIRSY